MNIVDAALLRKIAPAVRGGKGAQQAKEIADLGPLLQPAMNRYGINTFLRAAHFLAQICKESDSFCTYEEYASGEAYEGRTDLGNVVPGDGKRYKGRGIIQLTGRAGYRTVGATLGLPLEAQPELALKPENAVLIACEFWKSKSINARADKDDVVAVTRRVNGGINGLAERKGFLLKAEAALGGAQADTVAPAPEAPAAAPPAPARPATAAGDRHNPTIQPLPPLRLGATGAAVSRVQRMLTHKGLTVTADGTFGPRTAEAVRAFQRKQGLAEDGIVGRQTWWRLATDPPPIYYA